MPIGPTTLPDKESINYRVNQVNTFAQSLAKALLSKHLQTYQDNNITPWAGLFTTLYNRYTEVVVGRRPWYSYTDYGPYDTIPAISDEDRKRIYFREANRSLANGLVFKSQRQLNDGKWRRNIDIDFVCKSGGSTETEAETAEIVIYNVDPNLHYLYDDAPIVIRSGYVNLYDTIFAGKIVWNDFERTDEGVAITMKAVSDFRMFLGRPPESKSYPVGTKYMTIINELLSYVPIPIGYIHSTDAVLEDTFSWDNESETIKGQFDKMSKRLDYVHSIQGNKFHFVPKYQDMFTGVSYPAFILNTASGLIEVTRNADEMDYEYNVIALIVPHYCLNAMLHIKTMLHGELHLKVGEIEFRSDDAAHYANMKCNPSLLYTTEGVE